MRTSCGATHGSLAVTPEQNAQNNLPQIPAQSHRQPLFPGPHNPSRVSPSGCAGRYSSLRDYHACICQTSRCWRHAPPVAAFGWLLGDQAVANNLTAPHSNGRQTALENQPRNQIGAVPRERRPLFLQFPICREGTDPDSCVCGSHFLGTLGSVEAASAVLIIFFVVAKAIF